MWTFVLVLIRLQAITWAKHAFLSIGHIGTNTHRINFEWKYNYIISAFLKYILQNVSHLAWCCFASYGYPFKSDNRGEIWIAALLLWIYGLTIRIKINMMWFISFYPFPSPAPDPPPPPPPPASLSLCLCLSFVFVSLSVCPSVRVFSLSLSLYIYIYPSLYLSQSHIIFSRSASVCGKQ